MVRGGPRLVGTGITSVNVKHAETKVAMAWELHEHMNCYPGRGAMSIEASGADGSEEDDLAKCKLRCLAQSECMAVTVKRAQAGSAVQCWLRRNVDVGACEEKKRFSTHLMPLRNGSRSLLATSCAHAPGCVPAHSVPTRVLEKRKGLIRELLGAVGDEDFDLAATLASRLHAAKARRSFEGEEIAISFIMQYFEHPGPLHRICGRLQHAHVEVLIHADSSRPRDEEALQAVARDFANVRVFHSSNVHEVRVYGLVDVCMHACACMCMHVHACACMYVGM